MKRMRLDMMVCVTLAVSALALRADEKGRVAFRGFRGRYRLSSKDPDGNAQFKIIEVK